MKVSFTQARFDHEKDDLSKQRRLSFAKGETIFSNHTIGRKGKSKEKLCPSKVKKTQSFWLPLRRIASWLSMVISAVAKEMPES